MKTFSRFLVAALILVCPVTVVIAGAEAILPEPETTKPIPWSEVGAKAGAQYQGDGLGVTAISQDEAALRCVFQKLEGKAARDGLWITSTAEADQTERFRVMARAVGRMDQPPALLANDGKVVVDGSTASLSRPGFSEENSVSMDGVRQDFVVLERPEGVGALSVELVITGAAASAMSGGAELRLPVSGRKIAYTRLKVTDAQGQALSAHMEVTEFTKLRVIVEDSNAVYPVRIDPTFSDADWVSMGVSALGPTYVYALAVIGADVYIGGDFGTTGAGDVPCNNVVKWNGLNWTNLGAGSDNGVNGIVRTLAVLGDDLYVGGEFTTAGGIPAACIAKWDGTVWSALGSGLGWNFNTPAVRAMAVMNGSLYVGGVFNTAGGITVNCIARWSGSAWFALGTGLAAAGSAQVNALAVSGGNLYVGGSFLKVVATAPTTIYARTVALWNGTTWSALGDGLDSGIVYALAVWGGDLYAGGNFSKSGNITIQRLARWNGSTWSALGLGLGDSGGGRQFSIQGQCSGCIPRCFIRGR